MTPLIGIVGVLAGYIVGTFVTAFILHRMHKGELERFANFTQFGTPSAPLPEIVSPQPDATARIQHEIHESRVANGIAVIQQRYKDQGLTISDEEARIQVEAMLMGRSPVEIVA